jgi:tRNA U34 5-methylaminomethyl-2-thiouridine-forming methyltransferase MnmC
LNSFISPQLKETADKSFTLIHPIYNETYHSLNGAFTESVCVFISSGLNYLLEKNKFSISILELGLGSGLNAALTLMFAQQNSNLMVHYSSLEPFPISLEIAEKLGYWKILDSKDAKSNFLKIHSSKFDEEIEITQYFTFEKFKNGFLDYNSNEQFNLVYYDAFAPATQPELWTIEAFEHLNKLMVIDGVMVTYCAKGQVKRNLKQCGFIVESLPGPPGKREMIRATKQKDI